MEKRLKTSGHSTTLLNYEIVYVNMYFIQALITSNSQSLSYMMIIRAFTQHSLCLVSLNLTLLSTEEHGHVCVCVCVLVLIGSLCYRINKILPIRSVCSIKPPLCCCQPIRTQCCEDCQLFILLTDRQTFRTVMFCSLSGQ